MRSQQEILDRLKGMENDFFGWETNGLVLALTKESAETLVGTILKPDADLSDWEPAYYTDQEIRDRCIDYMEFAWGKANNCRGISAGRSMAHYKTWLWLLGEDQFEGIEDYEFYGKDHLVRICEFLGLDPNEWDDGVRRNSE